MAIERSILVLTPIATGGVLAPYTLGLPRLVSENRPIPSVSREVNININRARLQSLWKNIYYSKYEFVLLLDSDVVICEDCIELLVGSWKLNTTPCVRTKPIDGLHVVCACCLLSREDYDKVDYMATPNECQCKKLPNPFYVDGVRGIEI